jgi:glycerol-3-phosphate dehydrogenase (NAD(P)+)
MPTLIVSASEDPDAAEAVQRLFEGTCIRPYVNRDEKGVQICGALKNVEALAVGIARGLGYGDNTCAAMMTRGMEEIRRLGLAMGCTEKTFFGLAVIGDLIVTATSRHSRNNRAGFLIGQGMKAEDAVKEIGMVVEGMNALPAAIALCEKFGMDMPLINAVRDIIRDGVKPADVVMQLMNRSLKAE